MIYYVIRASEIAEYTYCSHAWWLRVEAGQLPASDTRMSAGTVYHRHHGDNVIRADRARQIALGLLFLAVGAFVFWLIRTT
jgi:CRISPR/Cas system-associated exonuclease Cas4 (RecB family)